MASDTTTRSAQANTSNAGAARPATSPASGGAAAVKSSLRGQSFDVQQQALTPRESGRAQTNAAPGAQANAAPGAQANAAPGAQANAAGAPRSADEPVPMAPLLLETIGGNDTTIVHDPDGPCENLGHEGNAMWTMTPVVQLGRYQEADGWHLDVQHFDLPFHWHLNPATVWNDIHDFPGGDYDPAFNTREGSERHELAEIQAVEGIYAGVEVQHYNFSARAFATPQELDSTYLAETNATRPGVRAQVQAVSNHSNPVGPNAEWAYYRSHARGGRSHSGGAHGGRRPSGG